MSHFRAIAWHPVKQRPEPADWYDGYFGGRRFGVRFDGEDKVYPEEEVRVPHVQYEAVIADLINAIAILKAPGGHSAAQLAVADEALARAYSLKEQYVSRPLDSRD